MEISPSSALLVALVVALASSAALAANNNQQSKNALSQNVLTGCIDDTDCKKLSEGHKYACFLYICYPWKDDSHVSSSEKRDLCRRNKDCKAGQVCYRHADKRSINKGLCLDEVEKCTSPSECSKGFGCCAGNCCEKKYYDQFQSLPCVSHLGCQDLNLGQFCCPQKNGTDACCAKDPNPTTPPPASPKVGAAGRSTAVAFLVSAAAVAVAMF